MSDAGKAARITMPAVSGRAAVAGWLRATAVACGVLAMTGAGAATDVPLLALPIACDAKAGCLIQNYFDHDAGPGFVDYTCGQLGYDGHTGTDFRLHNLAEMHAGVPVRAAAAGTVRAVRDDMEDVSIRDLKDARVIAGREAGNSVAIEHGNGWETQYSHLRRGSVRVKPGQEVRAGQVIGEVGLSGKTEFPHLHLSVRLDGGNIDPCWGRRVGRL